MAVVTDTRVLRSAPDGEAMSVLAKSGTRVQILDDKSHNPPWIKVALLDSPGAPQGWLSAGAVDPNANSVDGPLDKLVFGLECAWQAEAFGVTAHYLLAISELRSRVTNAVNANGDHGPFALSPFEWRFFNALPELDLGLDDTAIDSWRAQCAVFAAMVGRQQDKLSQLLSGQPTMSELYLAQMVGTKAAFAALRDQTRSLAEVLANLPDADLLSDGIERARIDARYGIVLAGSNIKAAMSSLDEALQKALDSTHPILTEVGGQILGSPSDEIPTINSDTPKTDTPPDRGPVVSPQSPGPVVSPPSPGPVVSPPSPGPVVSHPTPGPVVSHPTPGPVVSGPGWSQADLVRQFKFANARGWIPFFQKAAKDYLFPVEILLAIASRESNMKSIVGDHSHGYGIMQIDDRSFGEWCHSGTWQDVNACVQKGAQVLDAKREEARSRQGLVTRIGGKNAFSGAPIPNEETLLKIAISAYNCGLWSYFNYSKGRDIDRTTTGANYSKDVFLRSTVFKSLLNS